MSALRTRETAGRLLFARNGASGSSMGMAVSFAVALLCCVINIWAVRGSGHDR